MFNDKNPINRTPISASFKMDEFEKSKMTQKRSLPENTWYKWYNWLISHILETMKKFAGDAKKELSSCLKQMLMKILQSNKILKTPCLSTRGEFTPESSPVKMRPTKSVPGENGSDFLPPQSIFVI